jgi:hypothetical protein
MATDRHPHLQIDDSPQLSSLLTLAHCNGLRLNAVAVTSSALRHGAEWAAIGWMQERIDWDTKDPQSGEKSDRNGNGKRGIKKTTGCNCVGMFVHLLQ